MDRSGECREGEERAFLCGVDSFLFDDEDVRGCFVSCCWKLDCSRSDERVGVGRERREGKGREGKERRGKVSLKSSCWKMSTCRDYCSVLGGSVAGDEGGGKQFTPCIALLHTCHFEKRILTLS